MASKKADEVITAVYKVNLHCHKCAQDIKKPLMRIPGVHNVEYDIEKAEIKVKGVLDVLEIHKKIEKLSSKKVELVSPQIKIKETSTTQKKEIKDTKEILRTTTMKVPMHCEKCESDLRTMLLRHKDIYDVKTDMKAQSLTVHGVIEPEKLIAYIRKKVHKNAEIITSKPDKKIEEPKKEIEAKSIDTIELKEEKKVEVKTKESDVPYIVHYVYAPQLFSDENPNACVIS